MNIREKIGNSPVTIGAAVLGLALGLYLVFANLTGSNGPAFKQKWMYDLNTRQLIARDIQTLAPDDSGGGSYHYPGLGEAGSLVDVMVQICNNSGKVKEGMTPEDLTAINARIAYLSRLPVQLAEAIEQGNEIDADVIRSNTLVSDVEGRTWIPSQSPQADRVYDGMTSFCGSGEFPNQSYP